MNCRPSHPASRRSHLDRGLMLLELLIYISLFLVVLAMGVKTLLTLQAQSRDLRTIAFRMESILEAGERWREDIRQARGPIELSEAVGERRLVIPQAGRTITYLVQPHQVRRLDGPGQDRLLQLEDCRMEREPRPGVNGWRWEVRLPGGGRQKKLQMTFMAAEPLHPARRTGD